jgi:hypothetical protein
MIEIFNIISQLLIIFLLFNFPLNLKNIKKIKILYDLDFFEIISINLFIFLFVFLLISFFSMNFTYVILIILFLSLILNYNSLNYISRSISVNDLGFIFIILLSSLVLSVSIVSNLFLEWDGQVWINKAINFYENKSFFNLKILEIDIIKNYPHLGSLLWGIFWKISIINNEVFGRIIYVFIYVLSIGITVRKLGYQWVLQYIFFISFIFFTFDLYFFSGYQECLMFSMILILMNLFFRFQNKFDNIFILLVSLMFFNLLSWVKNEGVVYFLIFIILTLYRVKNYRILIVFSSVTLILARYAILNEISSNETGLLSKNLKNYLNLLDLKQILLTLVLFFKYLIISFFKNTIWLFIIVLFILSLIAKRNNLKIFYFITFVSIFFLLGIYLNYYVLERNNLKNEWFISVTLSRLTYHISAFYIPFIIIFINSFNKVKFK